VRRDANPAPDKQKGSQRREPEVPGCGRVGKERGWVEINWLNKITGTLAQDRSDEEDSGLGITEELARKQRLKEASPGRNKTETRRNMDFWLQVQIS
jgi:hypothetical protein